MSNAPVLDERVHRSVLTAAIATHEDDLPVYDYGKVPSTLPPIYALLSVERTYVQPRKVGVATRSGWRVSLRYVGRSVAEASWAGLKAAQALDQQRLVFDGFTSSPLTHESTTQIEPDDGRFSGLTNYTYTL